MELQSLDLEAIGSLVNDTDVMKEAKPSIYVKKILPILLKNRVVHFVGFGNRLSFDPIPFQLQRLPFSIDCFHLPSSSLIHMRSLMFAPFILSIDV